MALPLLILDLDETLLYADEEPLSRPADWILSTYHIYFRPFLSEFLSGLAGTYEMAVWTSASASYATAVVARIFPEKVPLRFIWSSSRCVRRYNHELAEYYDVKDLRKVKRRGFSLERTLVIDDSPEKLERHYGNHIRVIPFLGDAADNELQKLLPYLLSIQTCENFRRLEKRYWRSQSASSGTT